MKVSLFNGSLRAIRALRCLCVLCVMMLAVTAYAVPAMPGVTRLLTLTDGTTVNAVLIGDEFLHYWLGEDGKAYQAVSRQEREGKGGSDDGDYVYQAFDVETVKKSADERRNSANQQRARRMAPRKVGDVGGITGQKKGLIILVNFSDVAFQPANDNALYRRIANEENFSYNINSNYSFKGSMRDYFYDQSEGKFELTFDVVGPVTVSKAQSYYGENNPDDNNSDKHPAEMVIEALQLADSQVNYADYDWDGNKTVEQVYVVYAGKGEADGGESYTIWPHEWNLSSAKYYGDGSGAQKLDGVTINTYACGGELNGSTGLIAGIGTMCHEFSHCLGYPDFYDTDYSGGQGMGYWDLMSSGSYNGNGYQPAGYTSYERWVAGWKTPTELLYTQNISNMPALQTTGSDSYIIYNKGNNDEYYLLENRQKTGWDASLPGEGLLILHVDYNKSVWSNNKPNDDPDHQRMTWVAADNNYQYTTSNGTKYYTISGMKNDPFPYGSVNSFGKNTTPAATLYNNNSDGTKYLDSSIENITQNSDSTISFSFKGIDPSIIVVDESLSFSTTIGTPQTNQIELLSEGLTEDITVTLTDANNVFSIDKTSITKADSEAGATVTVTFLSATAGTYAGTITLSSAGADDVVVSLSGTAEASANTSTIKETIDFTAQSYTDQQAVTSVTSTNCTVTFDKGTNSNSPKYFTNGTAIRMYGGNTMTIASSDRTIVGITITFGSSDGSNEITTDVVTYSNGTWTGSASSVTFTIGGTSGNRRIRGVTVTYASTVYEYYQNADGKTGAELKTAMCGIIYNRTEQKYNDLWTAFTTTDLRSDGKIWDMYSNTTNYEPASKGETYHGEGDCYNREHSFPKSWFGGEVMPMFSDLHHIYPTDGYINGRRSNNPYGETDGEMYKSANNFSKLGTCTYSDYAGTVFEPADEYKGDFARTYFYMVTCYEEKLADWVTNYSASTEVEDVLDGTTYPALTTWQLSMLMKWAKNDPVSEKETNRNNAVYAIQNNRNPFIDYPGLEEYIWGTMTNTEFSYDNYVQPVYTTPVTVPTLAVDNITDNSAIASWTACDGVSSYTIQLASDEQFTEDSTTGEPTTLISESFEGNSIPSGWEKSSSNVSIVNGKSGDGTYCVAFKGTGAYLITPLVENPSNVSFMYKRSSNTTVWSLEVSYATSINGNWTTIGTVSSATTSWDTFSANLSNVGSVYIKFTDTRESGAHERYIDLVQITSGGSEVIEGSLLATETVNTNEYTFTGLVPATTYYVRVKGEDDWSNTVCFTTANTPLDLANFGDNTAAIAAAAADGGKYDVTLKGRTLYKDGNWNTLCLPFGITSGELTEDTCPLYGAVIKELETETAVNGHVTGYGDNTLYLNFKNATSIEAGKPYLIKWASGTDLTENDLVFSGVAIDSEKHDVTSTDGKLIFKGTYDALTFSSINSTIMLMGEYNKLYYPDNGASIGAQRAYFQLKGIEINIPDDAVRGFALDFGEGDSQGITSTNCSADEHTVWFDLNGRRLDKKPARKGLYISNGKKIVVK